MSPESGQREITHWSAVKYVACPVEYPQPAQSLLMAVTLRETLSGQRPPPSLATGVRGATGLSRFLSARVASITHFTRSVGL
jgi:hypothetical protein